MRRQLRCHRTRCDEAARRAGSAPRSRALADAKSVDEVKNIRDKSVAMAAYPRQAKNKELEADSIEIRMSVMGNGISTWQIDYTVDDPTGAYPNPTLGASGVTVFSTTSGSSTPTLCGVHHAGRRDQADHERAVERGRQGDRTILQSGLG